MEEQGKKNRGTGKKASGGIRLFILLIESPREAGNEQDKGEGRAMKSKRMWRGNYVTLHRRE